MNFEQLSAKYKNIKSPELPLPADTQEGSKNSSFIHFLQNEEAESKKKYYRLYILYGIGVITYLIVFIVNPDTRLTVSNRIMGTCFVAAFAILLVLFRKRYTELKRASFLDSSKQFLMNARKRHLFWNKQQLWMIPVLLLIDLGATISISGHLGEIAPATGILFFQLLFAGLMTFGFYMGKKEWTKNKKPILREIEKMLADFEA